MNLYQITPMNPVEDDSSAEFIVAAGSEFEARTIAAGNAIFRAGYEEVDREMWMNEEGSQCVLVAEEGLGPAAQAAVITHVVQWG